MIIPFILAGNDNTQGNVSTSSDATPAPRPPSSRRATTNQARPVNVPPMRISNRLRRVDVRNDSQFENMRRRLILEDLEADIKAKRAYEQTMKSQTELQDRQK